MVVTNSGRPPRPARRRGSADGQVLGALLVLGGVGWLVQQTGLVSLSVKTMLSALLITLGLGLVVTARRAGGAGLVVLGLVLTVVLASASAVDVGVLQRGAGQRTFRPTTAAAIADPFQLGVGSLTLDLRDLEADELRGESVRVQVGMGEVVVLLPPEAEVPVEIRAEARAGEIDLIGQGRDEGGTNVRRTFRDPAETDRLELDLDVGVGSISVVRPG
jgi:hypothetical protein